MNFSSNFYQIFDNFNDILNRENFPITITPKDGQELSSFNLDLPGFSKDEIEVSVQGDRSISVLATSKNNKRRAVDYSFLAPLDTDLNNLKPKLENGVLTIDLPKKQKPKAKNIPVE